MKRIMSIGIALIALTLGKGVWAEEITIATLEDAQVFAKYTDELPAVINYFTNADQQSIIDFYRAKYGNALSQELKYKRLTLKFKYQEQNIRIAISQQNNKRQVDLIITK